MVQISGTLMIISCWLTPLSAESDNLVKLHLCLPKVHETDLIMCHLHGLCVKWTELKELHPLFC